MGFRARHISRMKLGWELVDIFFVILIDVLVGDGGLSNRIVRIHAQGRVELIADDLLLSAPDVDLPDVSGGRARCGWGNGRELRRHWRGGSEAASTVGSGSDVARSGKCL